MKANNLKIPVLVEEKEEMYDPDAFQWSIEDKKEIKQLLKITYETLKSIMSDFAYMGSVWADFSQPKATREKEYKDTQAKMKNKMGSLKKTMNQYLKWLEPEDEEEMRIKKQLLGKRAQKGLLIFILLCCVLNCSAIASEHSAELRIDSTGFLLEDKTIRWIGWIEGTSFNPGKQLRVGLVDTGLKEGEQIELGFREDGYVMWRKINEKKGLIE